MITTRQGAQIQPQNGTKTLTPFFNRLQMKADFPSACRASIASISPAAPRCTELQLSNPSAAFPFLPPFFTISAKSTSTVCSCPLQYPLPPKYELWYWFPSSSRISGLRCWHFYWPSDEGTPLKGERAKGASWYLPTRIDWASKRKKSERRMAW